MAKTSQQNQSGKLKGKIVLFGAGAVLLVLIFGFILNSNSNPPNDQQAGTDLLIPKSGITETASFFPYQVGATILEVIAVKASDGSIRTAFNTCQVCYDSGRGYYVQEGDELVCQNCGNRFQIDQVEKIKGGCNPVPILPENKTDDGNNIVISQASLAEGAQLFANWGK